MNLGNWITVAAIVVGAIVSLIVAYLHRKQMRQVEAFRRDPSVGLVPPNPILNFLRIYWASLWTGAYGVFLLIREFRDHGPVTRGSVLNIVLGVNFIIFAFVTYILDRIYEKTKKTFSIESREKNQS